MKQIELLLLENVDNLGIVGDVVKVKPGYARNYLIPMGYATDPTAGAIKRLAEKRAEVEKQMLLKVKEQEEIIKRLEGFELTVMRNANEQGVLFGGVSQHDIVQALRAEGFNVEDRHVRVGQQIKRLDSYQIPIVLSKDLRTEIKLWVVSDKPVEQLGVEEDAGNAEMVVPAELDEAEA